MVDGTSVSSPALDDEDRILLRELVRDGRQSHRELAARTGLSLTTVNRRVRRLEEQRVILGYAARVAADAAGWTLTAIIGLRIDKGHVRTVQQAVAKDARVFAVYDVTGEWDGLVIARLRDRGDLDDLVKGTLSLEHINRSNTMMVLSTVLEEAVVRIAPEPPAKPVPRRARRRAT